MFSGETFAYRSAASLYITWRNRGLSVIPCSCDRLHRCSKSECNTSLEQNGRSI